MNTAQIKAYAPRARRDFIQAVTEKANLFGLSRENIEHAEIKGDVAIIAGRPFPKKVGELQKKLAARIQKDGFDQVMEAAAYTWFNRFAALRYMEIHNYLGHGFRVLSSRGNSNVPEILEEAANADLPGLDKKNVMELRLAGDKDNELYRILILAQCNALNKSMPFLFEKIDSETELLLPDNLLHSNSPVRKLVEEIDEEQWNKVEIIGWIYQFYISERKNEVIGKVVKSEDIPAATQLFTPNWIVKYMVQNTLGRMWLATYPDSSLKDKMEYYIEPAEQEPEVQKQLNAIKPKDLNPEEITFLDPASGSGHILVEAYNVFKEIYLERGYRTKDIPGLILEKNLYGLDIDDRAAQLACFAVLMKARRDDRRILSRNDLKLHVMAIQEARLSDIRNIEIFFKGNEYESIRRDLKELVELFEKGKRFGSLITVPDYLAERMNETAKTVEKKIGKWFSQSDVQNLAALVKQSGILAKKYGCVVTNPPYMGGKGMNEQLKVLLKDNYTDVKSDLFSAFIVRNAKLAQPKGQLGYMSPFVWMFISSYEKLRSFLINQKTITSLVQLEYSGFDGATVPICTFTVENAHHPNFKGGYVRLSDFRGAENQGLKTLEAIKNPNCGWFFQASTTDFKKIPGRPIAYWLNKKIIENFSSGKMLGDLIPVRGGMTTADNDKFIRLWYEVNLSNFTHPEHSDKFKWFPYNKGGEYRKWFGNRLWVVDWENDGARIKATGRASVRSEELYMKEMVGWTDVTSYSQLGVRYYGDGFLFDASGPAVFPSIEVTAVSILGFLGSKIASIILQALNATLHVQAGNISSLPWLDEFLSKRFDLQNNVSSLISIGKSDWDSYETSWDFTTLPLLQSGYRQPTLRTTYTQLRSHWRNMILEMQRLEEENNRIFIEAYGLQGELTPDVPLSEITLTCNPHYRYGWNKSEDDLETLLLTNTIKELISYAIGCMMGRYSLDHPGLIYAHSGNENFWEIYNHKTDTHSDNSSLRSSRLVYGEFQPDDDGIIPVMDQNWFPDDATNRFIEYLKVAWPPEHLSKNLKFVADSLKPKNNEPPVDTIRRYLSAGFFKDHLKTYKKRPIYWLFSSGKQKAFECLVYLHRYNESTLPRMRSNYVTPLQGKFNARLDYLKTEKHAVTTASAKKKIQKEIDILKKKQAELSAFDIELRHYADLKIFLDLDDGVKVNYDKFGNLPAEKKAITGKK